MGEPLTLVEDVKAENFVIKGITTESVASIRQIFDKLKKGELNRHYAETFMNHSSSRSHCLFRLTIRAMSNSFIKEYRQNNQGCSNVNVHADISHHEGTIVTESYLNFVDLAGSERMSAHLKNSAAMEDDDDIEFEEKNPSKTKVTTRIKEGKHINKSLFYLTRVIALKAEGKAQQYIPYRNSPLTKILRSSLGGNFRTAVVCCINPADSQTDHSISTLRFGSNAKKIQNKVQANILTNNDDETVRLLIENYERRMRDIKQQQDDEISKQQQYTAIIDELRMQRTALLDRLETVNRRFANKLVNEIEEEEVQGFFRAYLDEVPYKRSTGVLFSSPQLVKGYQEMASSGGFNGGYPKRSKADRILEKFDEEFAKGKGLGGAMMDAAALKKLDTLRREMDTMKNAFEKQRSGILSFFQSYKTLCGFLETVTGLGQVYLSKLREIIQEYEDEYLLSNERSIKLQLYENFKGLSLMSDKDLSTMKDYVADFADALKSEADRRELLATEETRLPQSIVEGLDELKVIEHEEQTTQMQLLKSKIEDFVKFKDGCTSEIDYYRSICAEFEQRRTLQANSDDIERLINEDLQPLAEKVKAMEANLRDYNSSLEVKKSDQINKQLKEYKSKFEKLVDVVLNEKKKRDFSPDELRSPKSNMAGDIITTTKERLSVVGGPGRLKRSNSICFVEDLASPLGRTVNQLPEKNKFESKVKGWLTLKALEDRPLDYETVLRDETASITHNLRSPNLKRDQDMNGSFSDFRSQTGNNFYCSDFASPMAILKLKDPNNRNLKTAFDITKVGSKHSDRERASYRSNLDNGQNSSAHKKPLNSVLMDKNERQAHDSRVNLFNSSGPTPVVKHRSKNSGHDSKRRHETRSYKASDMDIIGTFKRSFSNLAKMEGQSIFGSATEFNLNNGDCHLLEPILTDNRSHDECGNSIKESFILHQADDLTASMPPRHQSEADVKISKEHLKTMESSLKKPKLYSESHSKSKDKPSPWKGSSQVIHQKLSDNMKIWTKDMKNRTPSETKRLDKADFQTYTQQPSKLTPKLTPSSISKGLLNSEQSKLVSMQPPELFIKATSKRGDPSPQKEKRPSSSHIQKDHSQTRSIKGKIESLVSSSGYRGASGRTGLTNPPKK